MLKAYKHTPLLFPRALKLDSKITYSYAGIEDLFLADNIVSPPYIVTGNKSSFTDAPSLLDFLFLLDKKKRTR